MNEKQYLHIDESSEKKGMWYIVCFREANRGLLGYLSNSGKICSLLDKNLTKSKDLGSYFNSEDEAIECISKFYIIEKKTD
jgi:hypothetical protein